MIDVLLIEDNDNDAALAVDALGSQLNASIRRARTVAEATEQLASRLPTLIILDLGLPGGSGINNVVTLRGLAAETPIIVLTGWDEAFEVKILQAGASAFLTKQALLNNEFVETVEQLI
ncbi:MAG: response regulator [Planctomycetales bacterium]|nr:response regulator [Planctomycetales bacterium]